MPALLLDRRVTIEQRTTSPSATGHPAETWTVLDTVWAAKEDLGGTEGYRSQQIAAVASTRFTIRWRGDVTPENRVRWDGRLYEIVQALEEGRQAWLQLLCNAQAEG